MLIVAWPRCSYKLGFLLAWGFYGDVTDKRTTLAREPRFFTCETDRKDPSGKFFPSSPMPLSIVLDSLSLQQCGLPAPFVKIDKAGQPRTIRILPNSARLVRR
jgi:hypothetical protein